jgi:DNA-binding transcriptional LysR family regulator
MNAFENFDELRTFVRLVDEKSLSAAARGLRVSVNAVWRRLERIEARAGVKLVDRTTRALHVTAAGERLARHARRILAELEASEHDLATPAGGLRGVVRVALAADVASPRFIADLGELLRQNPDLHVELVARSRLLPPEQAGVDVVLWVGPDMPQSATVRRLGQLHWVLAAAPGYVARRGAPRTPEEISEHECLLAIKAKKETVWRLVDSAGRAHEVPVRGHLEADLPGILSSALQAGLGIGMRPRYEVLEAEKSGQLLRVLPDYELPPMEIALVTPAGRLRVPAVRAVADALSREILRQAGEG